MELIFYPKNPEEHIKNELAILKFIFDREDLFSQDLFWLYNNVKYRYPQLKDKKDTFLFSSKIDIIYNKRPGEVYFGVNINIDSENKNYTELTYYIAVCDKKNKQILLKFHFDYSGCDNVQRKKHPISHLQVGGRLPKELERLHYEYSLSKELDEPRIFHQPMTLALLINLIFIEFPNETYSKIMNRKEWRQYIQRDEREILSKYYKCCSLFLQETHYGEKLFSVDYCYGN